MSNYPLFVIKSYLCQKLSLGINIRKSHFHDYSFDEKTTLTLHEIEILKGQYCPLGPTPLKQLIKNIRCKKKIHT